MAVSDLTNRLKTDAAQALREIALLLKNSSRSNFEKLLEDWLEAHKAYLNERTIPPETGGYEKAFEMPFRHEKRE